MCPLSRAVTVKMLGPDDRTDDHPLKRGHQAPPGWHGPYPFFTPQLRTLPCSKPTGEREGRGVALRLALLICTCRVLLRKSPLSLQGVSVLALVTLWFYAVGGCPVHWKILSITGLHSLHASSTFPTHLSGANQIFLWTLSHIP